MGKQNPRKRNDSDANQAPERQRLDLWLWFARVVRTRQLAAKLAESGHVRINGARGKNAAKFLKVGDILTIALEREARVLRVAGFAERRGSYQQALLLFEELALPEAGRTKWEAHE